MKFFAKIAVICNLCFIATMVFRYVELGNKKSGKEDIAVALPFGQNEMVILGYCAILLNIIFLLTCFITFFINKGKTVPKWMYIFNGLVFIYQALFFFTNIIP